MSRYCKSLTGIAVCPCFKGKCPENKHPVEGFFFNFHRAHTFTGGDPRTGVCCLWVCMFVHFFFWFWNMLSVPTCWKCNLLEEEKIPRFARRSKLINKPRENCIVPESLWRNWWHMEKDAAERVFLAATRVRWVRMLLQMGEMLDWLHKCHPWLPWLQATYYTCKWSKW